MYHLLNNLPPPTVAEAILISTLYLRIRHLRQTSWAHCGSILRFCGGGLTLCCWASDRSSSDCSMHRNQ